MILEFSIENTYSIKNRQTISFEAADDNDDQHIINIGNKKLLKLAAIYGANASGKSNILKAFDFYMRFILDSFTQLTPEEKIFFEPFFFDENTRLSSGFFEIIFYFAQDWYKYQIRLNKEKVLSEYLGVIDNDDETTIFSFDTANDKREYLERDEELLRFVRPNATFLSTAAQFNHTFLGEIYRHLKDGFVSLGESTPFDCTRNMLLNEQIGMGDINRLIDKAGIDHNMYGALIQNRTLPKDEKAVAKPTTDTMSEQEKVTGRSFNHSDENSTKEIMFAHEYEKIYILPFLSESTGTRRFFELAGPLWDCMRHEKNLFIDELESSLHDDLIEFFIRSFIENTKESQLLFTTHNQTLLDSPFLRDDEVWFVQKDNNGGSEFFSLAEFEDVPTNVSRRELYKAGAFGALPRTAKFFKD
jgi:AAA15 family ATPase/GTPase